MIFEKLLDYRNKRGEAIMLEIDMRTVVSHNNCIISVNTFYMFLMLCVLCIILQCVNDQRDAQFS